RATIYYAPMMPENQKSIEQPERDRGDGKQIHRRDAVGDAAIMKTMGWQQPRSAAFWPAWCARN
ncbi:MAG TPA: hypothetical protein VJ251_10895, partial [Stellaceae bacterium]|nr:hypothetical protein [Stellaceae bacterium]